MEVIYGSRLMRISILTSGAAIKKAKVILAAPEL